MLCLFTFKALSVFSNRTRNLVLQSIEGFSQKKTFIFQRTQENLISSLQKNQTFNFLDEIFMLIYVKKFESKVNLTFWLDLFSRHYRCFSVNLSRIKSDFQFSTQLATFFSKKKTKKRECLPHHKSTEISLQNQCRTSQ